MLLIRIAGTIAKCVWAQAAIVVWLAPCPNGRSLASDLVFILRIRRHAIACDVNIGISRLEIHCIPLAIRYIFVLVGVVFFTQISLPLLSRGRRLMLAGLVFFTQFFLPLCGTLCGRGRRFVPVRVPL